MVNLILDIESGGLPSQYKSPFFNPILEISIVPVGGILPPLHIYIKPPRGQIKWRPERIDFYLK
jgi:hypothetical protein